MSEGRITVAMWEFALGCAGRRKSISLRDLEHLPALCHLQYSDSGADSTSTSSPCKLTTLQEEDTLSDAPTRESSFVSPRPDAARFFATGQREDPPAAKKAKTEVVRCRPEWQLCNHCCHPIRGAVFMGCDRAYCTELHRTKSTEVMTAHERERTRVSDLFPRLATG